MPEAQPSSKDDLFPDAVIEAYKRGVDRAALRENLDLSDGGVDFVVIGGVAAVLHGATRLTQDLDVAYRRDDDNLKRLVTALAPLAPYPRGAPPGWPFHWDHRTLKAGLSFTLTTEAGDIALFGEVPGAGDYSSLAADAEQWTIFGANVKVVSLGRLVAAKRAAGRPKDFEVLAELEALIEEADEDRG